MKYGISNSDYVLGILSEYSVFFSWMGLFFKTAQKILEVAHKTGVSKDSVYWLQYRVGCKLYEFYAGKWQEDPNRNIYTIWACKKVLYGNYRTLQSIRWV